MKRGQKLKAFHENKEIVENAKGHQFQKILFIFWQKSFRFKEKSIENPFKSFCKLFRMSEVPKCPSRLQQCSTDSDCRSSYYLINPLRKQKDFR